jgi:hypothetical protein
VRRASTIARQSDTYTAAQLRKVNECPGMSRRVVGVLGGMGPGATIEFMSRVLTATEASNDQDHIRMIIDSNPLVPDRTAFILGRGADPRPMLIGMVRGLECVFRRKRSVIPEFPITPPSEAA